MSDTPAFENIPVTAELLLAVLLKNTGEVEVPISDFILDYSECQITVGQDRDDYVVLGIVRPDNES